MLTSNNMVRTVLWICNLKRLGYDYEILTFLRRRSPFGYIEAPLQDLCNSLQMGGKEIPFRVSFGFPCGTDGIPFRIRDRKSTRLNSSHVAISYAVFCLKKKTKQNKTVNYKTQLIY